jgi:hypothetical protein
LTPVANLSVGIDPQAVVAADFNNDGRVDLATANVGSHNVSVLLGNADGTFQPAQFSAAPSAMASLVVGDFDGDTKLDLATVSGHFAQDQDDTSRLSVMFGKGNGTFELPLAIQLEPGAKPRSVAVGDFNDDGKMDLTVAADVDAYYLGDVYFDGGQASVLLAMGNRTFSAQNSVYAGGFDVDSVAVGYFNQDDDLDLVVGTYLQVPHSVDDGVVRVMLGDGEGNLATASEQFWGIDFGASMTAGDLDGDGDTDVVTANGINVVVRQSNGLGGFDPPGGGMVYTAGSGPTSVALGDFDKDGAVDIAVANYASSNVSVLRGRGDGTFAAPVHFAVGAGAKGVATGEFNDDGWLDIATANASGNSVSVLLNDRAWAPSTPPVFISVADASVTEGKRGIKYLTFTVSLAAASTVPVTVNYAAQNNSAIAGIDYQAQSGTLTFAAGEKTKTVQIAIFGDSIVEPDESFQLVLTNATGNAVISDAIGIGLILNDDVSRGGGKKK